MSEREIFARALKIEAPEERKLFLDKACQGDAALRMRIERLLSKRADIGDQIEIVPGGMTTVDQPARVRPGIRIGRYRLLEQIGEGGMGAVWAAEQTEPVKRRVALKLIKPGMDSREVLARFEAERQALALMDHPNITKIYDGGMTDDGRPYFVMEYVKGVPITEHCDQSRLTIEERLQLHLQVCQAVQHAHQKGIIHRDLKPSNILVCLYDGVPVPKVIDFGLAKAMGSSLTEHTLYTAQGMMVGTPIYMSPEQAEFNNHDIDTRTDIYSLGVVLYELLTGSTPLERQQCKDAAVQEILRLIKEVEPPKPSAKLSTSASLSSIAALRRLEPAQLSRTVRGELDWIVMKAIDKERGRRYETANGLARDISRFLANEPVEARPTSATYRLRKFARRNRMAIATASLIAGLLVLGMIGTSWQAVRATVAEKIANGEKQKAVFNQRRAEGAERQLKEQLRQSYFDQAQARRYSARAGRRFESLAAIKKAAELQPSLELRNEAIASMALMDVRVARQWEAGANGAKASNVVADAHGERYARSDFQGNISLRRISDDKELMLLPGPGQPAWSIRIGDDGQHLAATYCQDGNWSQNQLILWNLGTGKPTLTIPPPLGQHAMQINSIRSLLAVGHRDRTIRFYSTSSGAEMSRFTTGGVPKEIRFNSRGDRLAVITSGQKNVEIWDVSTLKLVHNLPFQAADYLAWQPDGELLALSRGPLITLWNTETGKLHKELDGHPGTVVSSLRFNQRGDLLVSSTWSGQLAVWDAYSGKKHLEATERLPISGPSTLESRPDSTFLWHNLDGAIIQFWEASTQSECRQFFGTGQRDAAFHPGGRVVAVCDTKQLRLWDLESGKALATWPMFCPSVQFHPNGKSLIASSGAAALHWPIEVTASDQTEHWTIGPREVLWTAPNIHSVALSPKGTLFAATNWVTGGDVNHSHAIVMPWDAVAKQVTLKPHHHMTSAVFSPDDQWIATSTFKGTGVKIWDAATGTVLKTLTCNANRVDVSPDGHWLVTGSEDEIQVWDVETWEPVHRWKRDRPFIAAPVRFSPDGRLLAASLASDTLKLIQVPTWEVVATLIPPDQQPFEALRFNQDGTRLAVSASGVLQVWDLRAVRNQLTQLGLDWDSPPYRPAERSPESPVSLVVEVVDEKEYRRQGVEHAAAGRWREAHQQLSKARQFGTQDLLVWLFDATSLLAAEDHPAYQALCVELLGGTQNERNATLQSGIAQILSIGPEAVPEGSWKHVRRFAEEAAAAAPNDPAHDDHLGAVCYRSGDYAGAIEYLERAIEKKNQGKSSAIAAAGRAWTEVFLAMAHYKNGNQFEAQKWLRFATQRVANEAQPGQSWFDRKINQLLLEEMRALLGVTQAEQFARIGAGKCQQEKWSEALPDFRRARDSNPFNPQHWLQEAAVLTAMDDAAGYNELCEEMLDFFENQDRIYLRTLVRAATLAPNSISKSDWMNLRSLAEQETLSPSGVDAALGEEVLGAICYRAGDFPAAVQHLKRSVDHWSEVVQANESARGCLTAELYLAMAHCRLNEPEEAARQLAAAEEYIERDWVDRAFRKGVKKEAKQLVEQATRSIDPP